MYVVHQDIAGVLDAAEESMAHKHWMSLVTWTPRWSSRTYVFLMRGTLQPVFSPCMEDFGREDPIT